VVFSSVGKNKIDIIILDLLNKQHPLIFILKPLPAVGKICNGNNNNMLEVKKTAQHGRIISETSLISEIL